MILATVTASSKNLNGTAGGVSLGTWTNNTGVDMLVSFQCRAGTGAQYLNTSQAQSLTFRCVHQTSGSVLRASFSETVQKYAAANTMAGFLATIPIYVANGEIVEFFLYSDAATDTTCGATVDVVDCMAASIERILNAALTETAGYLAAAFSAMFNVASGSRNLTTASVNQTGAAPSAADVAAAVWSAVTRTVTNTIPSAANIAEAVWSAATRTLSAFGFNVTASTVSDKSGYSLATAPPDAATIAAAVWNSLTSGITTANSIGKRLLDFVTTLVYSAPPTAAPSAADNAAAVATALLVTPANKIANAAGGKVTVGTNDDKSGYSLSVSPPTAQQIWEYGNRTLSSFGTLVADTAAAVLAAVQDTGTYLKALFDLRPANTPLVDASGKVTASNTLPALGTDGKTLISSDAQDLSATLSVNAKKLNGATPANLAAGADMALTSTAISAIVAAIVAIPSTAITAAGTILLRLKEFVGASTYADPPGAAPTAEQNGTAAASAILAVPWNKLATDSAGAVTASNSPDINPQDIADAFGLAPEGVAAAGSVNALLAGLNDVKPAHAPAVDVEGNVSIVSLGGLDGLATAQNVADARDAVLEAMPDPAPSIAGLATKLDVEAVGTAVQNIEVPPVDLSEMLAAVGSPLQADDARLPVSGVLPTTDDLPDIQPLTEAVAAIPTDPAPEVEAIVQALIDALNQLAEESNAVPGSLPGVVSSSPVAREIARMIVAFNQSAQVWRKDASDENLYDDDDAVYVACGGPIWVQLVSLSPEDIAQHLDAKASVLPGAGVVAEDRLQVGETMYRVQTVTPENHFGVLTHKTLKLVLHHETT